MMTMMKMPIVMMMMMLIIIVMLAMNDDVASGYVYIYNPGLIPLYVCSFEIQTPMPVGHGRLF
jgi:hypothetical protein